jgi:hypothetical protein
MAAGTGCDTTITVGIVDGPEPLNKVGPEAVDATIEISWDKVSKEIEEGPDVKSGSDDWREVTFPSAPTDATIVEGNLYAKGRLERTGDELPPVSDAKLEAANESRRPSQVPSDAAEEADDVRGR